MDRHRLRCKAAQADEHRGRWKLDSLPAAWLMQINGAGDFDESRGRLPANCR
jgi:hypothetical protein